MTSTTIKPANVLVNVEADNFGTREAALIATYIKNGIIREDFNHVTTLSKAQVLDFVKGLLAPVAGINITEVLQEEAYPAREGFSVSRGVLHTDDEYVKINLTGDSVYSDVHVSCFLTIANAERLNIFLNSHSYSKPRIPGVYGVTIIHNYIDKMGNTKSINHYKTTESFKNIRDDLYPKVNVPLLMEMYSESDENNLILTGSPGTGKTCFVKKCLRELALHKKKDIRAIYIKDRELLKKDEFWAKLSSNQPDVLVLDDLDDELLPRTQGRNDIVNNMLSFSDGLFDVDTKIIITTNQPNTAIDKALIRPGRCFDILALPNLTWEEALSVWLSGFEESQASFATIFGTDSSKMVSQASLISEYQRYKKSGEAPYLLDSSISIRTTVEDGGTANA